MADPIVAAALAAGAAFVPLFFLVIVLVRRRDPTGKAVAGYAVTRQALGETAARATRTGAAPRGGGDVVATVSVITSTDGGR